MNIIKKNSYNFDHTALKLSSKERQLNYSPFFKFIERKEISTELNIYYSTNSFFFNNIMVGYKC